jgi:hypothetical protein
MGESQFAKDLRREAQKQTVFAEAVYEDGVASRVHAEQGARHSEDAAIAARNAEYYAAEQLDAQLEHNEAVRAHQFALWRQETSNGQAYERWRERADPVFSEFTVRWEAWQKAKAEDIAAVRSQREDLSTDRFKLNSRILKLSAFLTRDGALGWWPVTLMAAFACGFMALMAWVSKFGVQTADLAVPALWGVLVLFLFITVGRMAAIPLSLLQRKRLARGREWVASEVSAFTSLLPRLWAAESVWGDAYNVHAAITSMPTDYVNFRERMLVAIPAGQPEPLGDDALPAEAVRTRSLLNSWRDQ